MSRLDPSIVFHLKDPQQTQLEQVQLSDLMSQRKERDAQTAFRLQETNRLKQQQDKSDSFNRALSEAGGQAYDDNGAELPVAAKLRQIDPIQADTVLPKLRDQWKQNKYQQIMQQVGIVNPDDPTTDPKSETYIDSNVRAIPLLSKLDPALGAAHAKQVYDAAHAQTTAAEAATKQFQNWHNQVASVANPNTIKDEASFNALKQQAPQLFQQWGIPPQALPHFLSDLGDSYDPVETPKRLEAIRQESMDEQHKISDAKEKATELKTQIAEERGYPAMIRQELKNATSQPLFTKARAILKSEHIPDSLLDQFVPEPGEGFPDFAERMRTGALTAEQTEKANEEANKTGDDLQSYLKNQAGVKGRPLTPQEKIDFTEKFKTLGQAATAANRAEPLQLVTHPDENGDLVQEFVPKVAGQKYAAKPTAVEQTRRDQAGIISREADAISAMIDAHPEAVGPILGRIARGETKLGNVDPNAKALGTRLGSFSALQPILHGFRGGGQTVEHFDSIIGDQHLNAAALKASLVQIKALAQDIRTGKAESISGPRPAPKKGDVIDGHEFLGGNPNDAKNWKAQ